MTFIKEEFIAIQCDNCKDFYENSDGASFFPDENSAKEEATNWGEFIEHEGNHYCSECVKTDPNTKKNNIPLHQGVFFQCPPEVDWCGVDYDGRLVFGIAKNVRYTWASERWRGFVPIGDPVKNTNFIPLTCLKRIIF